MPRHRRPRSLSDSELLAELVEALVEWMTTPGVPSPSPGLLRLWDEVHCRGLAHGARCVCEECCACFPELWPEPIDPNVREPF